MPIDSVPPFIGTVVHPTDLSPASERAFAHALAVALVRRARLIILHVSADDRPDWGEFPAVRATLERWGLLGPGSSRGAVFEQLGVKLTKRTISGRFPRGPSSITSTRLQPTCWSLRPRAVTAARGGYTVP